MKLILLTLLVVISISLKSQNIQGNWRCQKVLSILETDTINLTNQSYLSMIYTFKTNGEFIEDINTLTDVTTGNYNFDKVKLELTFSNLFWIHKFKGKVKVPDQTGKTTKPNNYVLEISSNKLVLMQKGTPQSEAPGDFIYYFIKN